MRTDPCRSIIFCMSHSGSDRRKSASVNAALLFAAALIPLLGALETPRIDHTEVRPWGCRSCPIPAEPTPMDAGVEDPATSL